MTNNNNLDITKPILFYTTLSILISIIATNIPKENEPYYDEWTKFMKIMRTQSRIFWILLFLIFFLCILELPPFGKDCDLDEWDLVTYIPTTMAMDDHGWTWLSNYLGGLLVVVIQVILFFVSFT